MKLEGLKNVKDCVICLREFYTEQYEQGKIDIEYYSDIQQRISWAIKSAPHKIRLVCGEEHYNELLEQFKDLTMANKCQKNYCGHRQKMHINGTGKCKASRCRCYSFAAKDDPRADEPAMRFSAKRAQEEIQAGSTETAENSVEKINNRTDEADKLISEYFNNKETDKQ